MLSLSKVIATILLSCLLSHAQVTANGGNDRTNANLQETQLSPATVSSATFGKIGTFPVDGQVYAQPLYVGGLAIGGSTRNVLFVATMHDTIYAFDADATSSPVVLWQANLGASVPAPLLFGKYGDIANEVGILSPPVIDPARGVIYLVSDTLIGAAPVFRLHALDLATGKERLGGPVVIKGSVRGTGSASVNGTVAFDPMQHIQRPGLLLANGAVYVAFGSHGDQSPYHGWMMSYDASDLTHQMGIFMSTPNGDEGSFWQSGRGPAADSSGSIYAITGNGDYDGVQNFGQSVLKLAGAAPVRIGSYTPAGWKSMSDNDADLSAGPALISGTHTLIAADKNGQLYVLSGDAMAQPDTQGTNAFQVFQISAGSIFNLAVWSRPGNTYLFVQAENDPVKCYQVTPSGFNSSPISTGLTPVPFGRIGMTLSANGTQYGTGILWETTGDYNDGNAPGTLHAYDASNVAAELWNSDMNPDRDAMGPVVKFVGPTVANGKVYVPSLVNSVVVYGVLSSSGGQTDPQVAAAAGAASYATDALSPGEIVAIFGSNLGPANPVGIQLDASGSVSTTIADTQVLFDGVPGPMVWASAGQVNAVVPFGVSSQTTQVQVQYQGRLSNAVAMTVAPSSPGVFSLDGSGTGQGAVLNQDGGVNSADSPAPSGSVIVLYATGAGQFSPPGIDGAVVSADNLPAPVLPVSVQIGGQNAKVIYAGGAPGIVEGVLQVNVEIPAGVTPGPSVPLLLQVGDRTSQPGLTVAVGTSGQRAGTRRSDPRR
jgi:uncharacterized protein (TIGR03437 family)